MDRSGGAGLDAAAAAIRAVRKAKSAAGLSQKATVTRLNVRAHRSELDLLRSVMADVANAGNIGHLDVLEVQEVHDESRGSRFEVIL